jgi:hypothetical protein
VIPRNTTEKRAYSKHIGVSGGDGGELNSSTLNNPILVVFSLLDQISGLGDTAKLLKNVLVNHNSRKSELLKIIMKIPEKTNAPGKTTQLTYHKCQKCSQQ